jgi:arsenite/tail-anchored protein-transporting ATPase
MTSAPSSPAKLLVSNPTPFLLFTGKGGVGKTTLACATAIHLADTGQRVLLVSTDPASNLDEMLDTPLSDSPRSIKGVPGLWGMNIDPGNAADAYRSRVIDQMAQTSSETEVSTVREQLSGACTTEIAAFDEFAGLLTEDSRDFDRIVFDTAPTGHTLRLLSLPKAWTGFLANNDRGASCLGPHSGLKMQEGRFRAALAALANPARTSIMLVTRPDTAAIREAARTSGELADLGLSNQILAVNGVFTASDPADPIARSMQRLCEEALDALPTVLQGLPQVRIPLRSFDMVGLAALRRVMEPGDQSSATTPPMPAEPDVPSLKDLIDRLTASETGLVMVMGKGGVGKTTVAAAIAVGLARRGHSVHLSTTDPAAHISAAVDGQIEGLTVDRIDPKVETEHHIEKIIAGRAKDLDADGLALLREDLASPCTEEVAVFHAFSRIVSEARSRFVVLDTAPTGHTLLLMDATGAYHRQITKNMPADSHGRITTPLMRLQDPDYARIILVTLPETTPVSEAAELQQDLRRAKIEPYAWVVNRSLLGTSTNDPVLRTRMIGEQAQIARIRNGLAKQLYLLPWQAEPPIGILALSAIASG